MCIEAGLAGCQNGRPTPLRYRPLVAVKCRSQVREWLVEVRDDQLGKVERVDDGVVCALTAIWQMVWSAPPRTPLARTDGGMCLFLLKRPGFLTHGHSMKGVAHEHHATMRPQVQRRRKVGQLKRLGLGVVGDGEDKRSEGVRPRASDGLHERQPVYVSCGHVNGLGAAEEARAVWPGDDDLAGVCVAVASRVAWRVENYGVRVCMVSEIL
jgi:hypothetical protein